jgi:hypothetical protein
MVEGMTKPKPKSRIRALIRTVALLRRVVTEIRGLLITLASLVAVVAAMTRHWL